MHMRLKKRGIESKRIGIFGKLNYAWLVSFLAVVCSGNVAVPLDENDNDLEQKLALAKLSGIYGSELISKGIGSSFFK